MIRITQLKMPVTHTGKDLQQKISKTLRIRPEDIRKWTIIRRSIDARKKPDLCYVYTIDVVLRDGKKEKNILSHGRNRNIARAEPVMYRFPEPGNEKLLHRPVIIGSGPAGLFCARMLAQHGYCPILLERGEEASIRRKKVDTFWQTGKLDPDSNVQFGEGGAGTFSDGKLNTGVKDREGRNREVLRIFREAGAPEEIMYDARPHLGTDQLVPIVENIRHSIEQCGGEVRFRTKMTGLEIRSGRISAVYTSSGERIETGTVVLAIGHSARDTFFMLHHSGIPMEAKAFAMGVRVEHPQKMITESQYGAGAPEAVGPADYHLAYTDPQSRRGVYSFCMCPGGYVVNASSEEGYLAVNGMSYHDRGSANANSAIVVQVRPDDYESRPYQDCPAALRGILFQRDLEKKAYLTAGGAVPVQRFADFRTGEKGGAGRFSPCIKGRWEYANVREILPNFIAESICGGILQFEKKISGFSDPDTLLEGVESRTSSPVRILRNESLESDISGIYPCGEGAGYAGGITSAAMDGLKVAEAIARKYMPIHICGS